MTVSLQKNEQNLCSLYMGQNCSGMLARYCTLDARSLYSMWQSGFGWTTALHGVSVGVMSS